ncbi:MAG TPA: Obg family GTPase CgtA, partial [Acidimicrobiales bacterium]
VALSDLTDDGAVDYVQSRLRRLGVERALVRAGIRDGDVVHLGALSFTYQRDEGIDAAVGPPAAPPERRAGRNGRSGA